MAKKATKKTTKKKAPVKKKAAKKPAKKPAKKATKKKAPAKKTAKPVAKPVAKKKNDNVGLKVLGLVLNIVILPGLGTLIGGGKKRQTEGTIQLILAVIGWVLLVTIIGAVIGGPLLFIAWVWGIVAMARSFSD